MLAGYKVALLIFTKFVQDRLTLLFKFKLQCREPHPPVDCKDEHLAHTGKIVSGPELYKVKEGKKKSF